MGLKRTDISAWLACQQCHSLILTLAHLHAYRLFTNLLAPCQTPLGSPTQRHCSTQACACAISVMLNCFPRNVCSASFAFSCTSQVFIPPSRCCLPTCPNALNQRIAYKYDLSLSFPSSLSLSLCYSLFLSQTHPPTRTHVYLLTAVHAQNTNAHKHVCTHTNTQNYFYDIHLH